MHRETRPIPATFLDAYGQYVLFKVVFFQFSTSFCDKAGYCLQLISLREITTNLMYVEMLIPRDWKIIDSATDLNFII